MKKIIFAFSLLVAGFLLLGCAEPIVQEDEQYVDSLPAAEEPLQPPEASEKGSTSWMEADLADVRTGQTFKISDFRGKKVLLESFAVWCPTCTQQQKKIKELHEEIGDAFVSISLDTDPNEDADKVKEAVDQRGFEWYFAVSPAEATKALIDQFGISVVDAPSAPVVLICEDGSARLLKRGIKSAQDLKAEMAKGC